jgi:hypothetical protein
MPGEVIDGVHARSQQNPVDGDNEESAPVAGVTDDSSSARDGTDNEAGEDAPDEAARSNGNQSRSTDEDDENSASDSDQDGPDGDAGGDELDSEPINHGNNQPEPHTDAETEYNSGDPPSGMPSTPVQPQAG